MFCIDQETVIKLKTTAIPRTLKRLLIGVRNTSRIPIWACDERFCQNQVNFSIKVLDAVPGAGGLMASAGSKRKTSRLPLIPLRTLKTSANARLIKRYLIENSLLRPGKSKNALYIVVKGKERATPANPPNNPPVVPMTTG